MIIYKATDREPPNGDSMDDDPLKDDPTDADPGGENLEDEEEGAATVPRGLLDTNNEELIRQFGTRLKGWFGLIICDEVHFLKNTNSLMHRAVELLEAREKLFLTGTPMIDRPIDLAGILQLLWDRKWDADMALEAYQKSSLGLR